MKSHSQKLHMLLLALFVCTLQMYAQTAKDLEGVWELVNHVMYENDVATDTLSNQNGYRQIKMYSKGHVMWTRNDPSDPNEWFGYGTYSIKDGKLMEQLEYASGPMMKIVDTTKVFAFDIVYAKDSFEQIQLTEDGLRSMAERYKKIH